MSLHRPVLPERRIVTSEETQMVRSALTPADDARAQDEAVVQFIRACKGNTAQVPVQASKRLANTLAWRSREQPDRLAACPACTDESRSHYMHVVGHDRIGRPVIYSCCLVKNRVPEDNRIHMLHTFEQAIRLMEPGVEQWVWVCDFVGFGLADTDPRIARAFLDLASNHYPERLGCFIVLDAPRVFSLLWSAIKPVVDPITKEKVVFSSTGSQLDKVLQQQHFGPELREWISAEVQDNRRKSRTEDKVYCYKTLPGVAAQAREDSSQHNHYGTSELLQKYAEQPHLLKPVP